MRRARWAAIAAVAGVVATALGTTGAPVAAAPGVTANGAPSLFTPAAAVGVPPNAAAAPRPEVMRSQLVTVNRAVLFDASGAPADLGRLPRITLNLFPNATYVGIVTEARQDQWGSSWSGTLAGVDQGYFFVTVVDDVLMTHVASPQGVYEVTQAAGNLYRAVQIDQSEYRDHPDTGTAPAGPSVDPAPLAAPVGTAADTGSTIDIMVVYTAAARTAAGSTSAMKSTILTALNETNTSYGNSGVTPRLRLVHVEEVSYTESGDIQTDVDRLAGTTDGYMDNVHGVRNTYGADLVGLIVENGGGYCGMAKVVAAAESTAFQVTARSCATGNYSFGHEFGHLQSARHDTYVDSTNTPYAYGHGYVNTSTDSTKRWRTVMAYNDRCKALGYNCTRLIYWSNPNNTYLTQAMGVTGTSENYKVLNNTAFTVANFRTQVIANDFSDSFTSTVGNWSAVGGTWALNGTGQYQSSGLANSGASAKNSGKFGDVTYQATMTRSGGATTLANRIILRGNPSSVTSAGWWKPSYVFQYSNDGTFSVYKNDSTGTSTALKAWTTSSAIVKGGANTLKVVAVGSTLQFSINGTLVWSGTDTLVSVGQVGVGFYRDATAATLKVDSASASTTATAADLVAADTVSVGATVEGGTIDASPSPPVRR